MDSGSGPADALAGKLRERPVNLAGIASLLDGLAPAERGAAVRCLGRSQQRTLYEAAEGFGSVRLVDLVPADRADRAPVRHIGRNTLPLFTHFEKHFCRPPGARPEAPRLLYGFNYQPTVFLRRITGPGYFVAVEAANRPEVLIDYQRLPPDDPQQRATGWPEVRANDRGASRFVYGFMVDTLRRVSEHVTIGSAARGGRDLGSWFLLCREP